MRIAHFCPFGPHRSGMYETVRDVIAAERALGHEADLFATEIPGEGNHAGEEDSRRGCVIVARDTAEADDAYDVFVVSGGIAKATLDRTRVPVVQIMHGRPEHSFRSVDGPYVIYRDALRGSRHVRFVTLWPEHLPYWQAIIPPGRLACTSAPPLDLSGWSPHGPRRVYKPGPNVLVADVWRSDGDAYHLAHGALYASRLTDRGGRRLFPNLRVHVYGAASPLGPSWVVLLEALRQAGCLGEVKGMMFDIDSVYRGCDVVLTGHHIATRIVREAWACGRPVVAPRPSRYSPFTYDRESPESMAVAVANAVRAEMPEAECVKWAEPFDSMRIAKELVGIYEGALAPVGA